MKNRMNFQRSPLPFIIVLAVLLIAVPVLDVVLVTINHLPVEKMVWAPPEEFASGDIPTSLSSTPQPYDPAPGIAPCKP